MNASKMMARITTTTQKKNTMMPGMAYPATVLALATAHQLPTAARLIRRVFNGGVSLTGRTRPQRRPVPMGTMGVMNSDTRAEVTALAINVTIPEALRWTDSRRGQTFTLTTLNVRLLADGHLAAKAYGRPVGGGRGAYVSFPVPENPKLTALVAEAATRAGSLWAAHRGLR